ncbi:LysR family transcriptional regulator [Candidatus Formimonas warabiya]|uniref:LysR family transcriptional regulator n=1 Tax=Formimonas warabiya TaxID=1761012 RepID=A0A3G1KLU0_FORW1|nr:LysR family transcriptional regulator [Candidatus Formimonas warabiya]ATW23416.1 LysR family transcriptional regulator [Candidatus Formimonas warabiya]
MDINFELYKVFYHVAQSLSFSTASERLCISQSAVSQSIRSLEEKFNCKLFLRNSKHVALTQEGLLLFKHIEQAFNFIKSGEQGIQEMHSLKYGTVRIGASDTICKYYLLPYLKKFNQLYPQIKIQVTNRTSPRCLELLNSGFVDIAVINLPLKTGLENAVVKKIKAIQDVFIAGPNFSGLKGQKIPLPELARYPLLMLEKDTVTRKFFDDFLGSHGVRIVPEIELGSVDLLVEMTRIGLGISFVMENAVEKELAADEVFVVTTKEKIPSRKLGVITNARIPVPVAAEKFIEVIDK